MLPRRSFLKTAGGALALAGLGDLRFLSQLRPVGAAEARLNPALVRLSPEIEPLVRLLEETPREKLLEEMAARIKRGLSYPEVLAALLLAGVRNIQPRPVGFKFHAVLVVNSAHLAALSAPDSDRWLPIFWALDQFKSSQAADVREGDWALGPIDEGAVPPSHKARAAFLAAMDNWDESAADAAIVGLARTSSAHEIFQLLCRYGVRDFRELGHKQIYIANSFRTLEVIGWRHAEPVLRSLAYALLDRVGDKVNPATADLPADRPFRRNLELVKTLRPAWLDGKRDDRAVVEMIQVVRTGASTESSEKAVELLNRGVAPASLFDGYLNAAGELLMRAPGILSLHATTFSNAVRYSWDHCDDEQIRKLLLVQNAAFLPLFRGNVKEKGAEIDTLEPMRTDAAGAAAVEEIFSDVGHDRLLAARKILAFLKENGDAKLLADSARRLIFLKGRDAHDYKFSAAVLEDFHSMPESWRNRYLAASVFNLRSSRDSDNDLVARTRAAFA